MTPLDLANPECDVKEILREFKKYILSNWFIDPTLNRHTFVANDLYWWLKRQRNLENNVSNANYVDALLEIWLEAKLININYSDPKMYRYQIIGE